LALARRLPAVIRSRRLHDEARMKPYIAWAVMGAIALDAAAQQQPAAPHAGDPAARVPQASYRSTFEGYRAYREQALLPWREVNDEVARIGGHMGIFRAAVHGGHGQGAAAQPGAAAGSNDRKEAADKAPAGGAPQGGGHGH
jgi:hypothetical protein